METLHGMISGQQKQAAAQWTPMHANVVCAAHLNDIVADVRVGHAHAAQDVLDDQALLVDLGAEVIQHVQEQTCLQQLFQSGLQAPTQLDSWSPLLQCLNTAPGVPT